MIFAVSGGKRLILLIAATGLFFAALAGAARGDERKWEKIEGDGLHDPEGPAIHTLQDPGEALSALPPDPGNAGNKVSWPKALENGFINPRTSFDNEKEMQVLDMDILFKETREMPMVLFPHVKHTVWLDCSNCHDKIFKAKAGATPVNMFTILMGEHCGRCHGAVAFPLTECLRCHSVEREGASVKHRME